ncbi:MAG: phosphotransferase [Saprospiraceae bacterium]|nr:phosphotransferase [Saprospiraceae bacterium]
MYSSLVKRLHDSHPGTFFLNPQDPEGLERFLHKTSRLSPGEHITNMEKPGEGNMNCVVRVITNIQSFIIKQARPWVEKYPQVAAPIERILVEGVYLQQMQSSAVTSQMTPSVLWEDASHYMMALEDLGHCRDLINLYAREQKIDPSKIRELTSYLRDLHRMTAPDGFPANLSMKKLNHEHIFRFPFDPQNGLALDEIQPGLSSLAEPIQHNAPLKQLISSLGLVYLSDGFTLLHGDFYPGSWLDSTHGLRVIDPEFAFLGTPEFDLGIMMAHMFLSSQNAGIVPVIWQSYGRPNEIDVILMSGFAGVEILRRLIGIAQLPLPMSIDEKRDLIQMAQAFVEEGALAQQFN